MSVLPTFMKSAANGDTRLKRTSMAVEDPKMLFSILFPNDRKAAKQATSNGQVAVAMLPTGIKPSKDNTEAFLGFATLQFMSKDMEVTLETPDDLVMITNKSIDPCMVMSFSKVGPAVSQTQEETYRFVGFFTTKVTADLREKSHTVGARSIVGGLHLPGLTTNKSGYVNEYGMDASFRSIVSCSTPTIVQKGDMPALDAGVFNANFQILFHPEPDKVIAAIRKKTSCPHATVDPSLGSYAILVGDRQLAPPCTGEKHRRNPMMAKVTNVKQLSGGGRVAIELSNGSKKVTATAWADKLIGMFGIVHSDMLTTDFFRGRWFAFYLVPSKPSQTGSKYDPNFSLYAAVQIADTTIQSIGSVPDGSAVDGVAPGFAIMRAPALLKGFADLRSYASVMAANSLSKAGDDRKRYGSESQVQYALETGMHVPFQSVPLAVGHELVINLSVLKEYVCAEFECNKEIEHMKARWMSIDEDDLRYMVQTIIDKNAIDNEDANEAQNKFVKEANNNPTSQNVGLYLMCRLLNPCAPGAYTKEALNGWLMGNMVFVRYNAALVDKEQEGAAASSSSAAGGNADDGYADPFDGAE